MRAADYDIAVVGGGICGASLAKVMVEAGARVVLLEEENRFRDRVRGEFVEPWGVAELQGLGLRALLEESGARALPQLANGSPNKAPRDLTSTSAPRCPALTFYHPDAQETLLQSAGRAGVDVRRGVRVREIRPGSRPSVVVRNGGTTDEIGVRLVVGADGRNSLARKVLGLREHIHDPGRRITGARLDGVVLPECQALIAMNSRKSLIGYLFPQGGGRARAYAAFAADAQSPMQGERDLHRLIESSVHAGAPADAYAAVGVCGPLATFDCTENWVEHPYRDGVVLIGDAAGVSDPTWGQGLSLVFRDVRVLRDALLAHDDWDASGHAYAEAHDRYFRTVITVISWFTELFLGVGPEADARRSRARSAAREDPTRVPDHMVSGPDLPADETVRLRFFGEEERPGKSQQPGTVGNSAARG